MTTTESKALATSDDVKAMLASSNAVMALREETAVEIARAQAQSQLLTKQGASWVKDATPAQLEAFVRACVGLELNPLVGEAYLIHGGFYVGIQGRRKRAAQTGLFAGESAPRLLTPEENEIHGVKPGDVARIVEVWRDGMRLPGFGVGIIRKGEIAAAMGGRKGPDGLPFSPLGRDPEGMAAKRASSKAYRVAFADIDLPTADVEGHGASARVIDADTGEVLAAANRQLPERFDTARAREEDERAMPVEDAPLSVLREQVRQEEAALASTGPTLRERVKMACMVAEPDWPPPTDKDLLAIFGGVPLEALEGERGITAKDAENIAAAVFSVLDPEGSIESAAAAIHQSRAEAGLSFVPDAILEDEKDDADESGGDDPPPPSDQQAPPARGKQARLG